jgi:calcineurin-like phosphoesterase family protein
MGQSVIYFTADMHLFHKNIIRYCDRPFSDVRQMNKCIIDNYNDVVNDSDHVYFLGDMAHGPECEVSNLAQCVHRLNGWKHLILGNHDRFSAYDYVNKMGFMSVHTWLKMDALPLILVHDPAAVTALEPMMQEMAKYNNTYLVGHLHGLIKEIPDKHIINVGVDVNDFRPVPINQILERSSLFPDRLPLAPKGGS